MLVYAKIALKEYEKWDEETVSEVAGYNVCNALLMGTGVPGFCNFTLMS